MRDKEILDKYMDLEKSCLTKKEKKEVMEMLYKYKDWHVSQNGSTDRCNR